MNLRNEQELLAGARSCELTALEEIYDRYSPAIYRYAMRLLGDDFLSEECVSETFSRFLHSIRAGQGPTDHLQAYLFRIAHNWITDIYRRQSPPTLDLDDSLQDNENPPPENIVAARLEQHRVRLALRSLTPDQRQVVTLRFLEGWENEEVAAALCKPIGAIKALQFRAVHTLRKLLIVDEKAGIYEAE